MSAEDLYGNLATSFPGSVTLTLDEQPRRRHARWVDERDRQRRRGDVFQPVADKAGAGYTLQASSGGVASAVTGSFTVAPAVATQLVVFTQPPGNVTAGSGFTVVVEGEDSFGNLDQNFSGTVMLALANNPGGPGAMPGGPLTATAVSGLATFTNVLLDKAGAELHPAGIERQPEPGDNEPDHGGRRGGHAARDHRSRLQAASPPAVPSGWSWPARIRTGTSIPASPAA